MADRLDEAMDLLEFAYGDMLQQSYPFNRREEAEKELRYAAARQAVREAAEDAADTAALHAADQAWDQIYALVGDDAFAATFQTLGQYRAALMDGAGVAGGGAASLERTDALASANGPGDPLPIDPPIGAATPEGFRMTDHPIPDAVARVLAEYGCGHHEDAGADGQPPYCGTCGYVWPCPTYRRKIEAFGEKAELSMEDQLVLAWDALGSAQRRAKVAEDTAAALRTRLARFEALAKEAAANVADYIPLANSGDSVKIVRHGREARDILDRLAALHQEDRTDG